MKRAITSVQTLLLILLTSILLPAAELKPHPTADPLAPLRQLHDGRVVDFSGIFQLGRIMDAHGIAAAARARNHQTQSFEDHALEEKQDALWRLAVARYRVTGTVMSIGTGGIYVEQEYGFRFSRAELHLVPVKRMVWIENVNADKLIDGSVVTGWCYPTGPHHFLNSFHQSVTIPGFEFGDPFRGDTNQLRSIIPAGETNIIVPAAPAPSKTEKAA